MTLKIASLVLLLASIAHAVPFDREGCKTHIVAVTPEGSIVGLNACDEAYVKGSNLRYIFTGTPGSNSGWTATVLTVNCSNNSNFLCAAGKAGGMTVIGGTGSGENLTLSTTSHSTKGKVLIGSLLALDETLGRIGVGTTTPEAKVHSRATAQTGTGNVTISSTAASCPPGSAGICKYDVELTVGSTVISDGQTFQVVSVTDANNFTVQPSAITAVSDKAWTYQRPLVLAENSSGTRELLISAFGSIGIGPTAQSGIGALFAYMHLTGTQPASISTGNGANSIAILRATSPKGGNTSSAGSNGGNGGAVALAAGAGGDNTALLASGNGGFGATVSITGGAGGALTNTASGGAGGGGGGANLTAGAGGNAPSSGINGDGGNIVLTPGLPGAGAGTAGNPGSVNIPSGFEFRFYEPANTEYSGFAAGSQSANISYTLPTTAPTTGQVLSSTSAGVMSWVSAGGGVTNATDVVTGSSTAIATSDTILNTVVATPGSGTDVNFIATVYWTKSATANKEVMLKLFKDGTEINTADRYAMFNTAGAANQSATISGNWVIASESAGSHTYTLRAIETQAGTGTANRITSRLTVQY